MALDPELKSLLSKLFEGQIKLAESLLRLDDHVAKLDEGQIKLAEGQAKLDEHVARLDDHIAKLDERLDRLTDQVTRNLEGMDRFRADVLKGFTEAADRYQRHEELIGGLHLRVMHLEAAAPQPPPAPGAAHKKTSGASR